MKGRNKFEHFAVTKESKFPPFTFKNNFNLMLSTKAVTVQTQQYVGFDTITKQMEKRLLKQTFQLNLMVVGKPCPLVNIGQ